jgi:oligoribonuclease
MKERKNLRVSFAASRSHKYNKDEYSAKPEKMNGVNYEAGQGALGQKSKDLKLQQDKSKLSLKEDNLIWIDLEFSGLDFKNDKILEIATIITNQNLNILEYGPNIAIQTEEKYFDNADEWNKKMHQKTGLKKKCLNSLVSMKEAEKKTLDFLKNWTKKNSSPMCGNSVGQDRRMLFKDMPELEKYFHYRIIDVSTIKELSERWNMDLTKFKKEGSHTALRDIEESIEELRYYKRNIFDK